MKGVFVRDLVDFEGKEVEGSFILIKRELRKGPKGMFLYLLLGDKTGQVEGYVFDDARSFFEISSEGDILNIRGFVYRYNNQLRIKVTNLSKLEDYELEDYIKRSPKDIEEMWKELKKKLVQIQNPYLKKLVDILLSDENFVRKFKEAPAATRFHHNYIGGLLEHTVNLVKMAEALTRIYHTIDKDLLVFGCFIHDIGKIDEYTSFPVIGYTDEGKLLGHIPLGFLRVKKLIDKTKSESLFSDFPRELELRILHIILSHHGELVKGSPVEPLTIEAQIIHFLDYLDSRIWMFEEASQFPSSPDSPWSDFYKPLSKSIFIGLESLPKEEMLDGFFEQ